MDEPPILNCWLELASVLSMSSVREAVYVQLIFLVVSRFHRKGIGIIFILEVRNRSKELFINFVVERTIVHFKASKQWFASVTDTK
jgi:hypothetical protein